MRLLTLNILEPLPGRVLPEMAVEQGSDEAARRYRAIVVTTLRQLCGLRQMRLRLIADPVDASEAVRFWLLPRLAGRWQMEGDVFRSDGWEIDFGEDVASDFTLTARAEVCCPWLGERWVRTALIGFEERGRRVVGPASGGGEYFLAEPRSVFAAELRLPELPVIRTHGDWLGALAGPLGGKLRRAWEDES